MKNMGKLDDAAKPASAQMNSDTAYKGRTNGDARSPIGGWEIDAVVRPPFHVGHEEVELDRCSNFTGANWACSVCTYAGNHASLSACEMCGGMRKPVPPPPPPITKNPILANRDDIEAAAAIPPSSGLQMTLNSCCNPLGSGITVGILLVTALSIVSEVLIWSSMQDVRSHSLRVLCWWVSPLCCITIAHFVFHAQVAIANEESSAAESNTHHAQEPDKSGGAGVPDHIRNEEQMQQALHTWFETSSDAAFVFFTGQGIWVQTGTKTAMLLMGSAFLCLAIFEGLSAQWRDGEGHAGAGPGTFWCCGYASIGLGLLFTARAHTPSGAVARVDGMRRRKLCYQLGLMIGSMALVFGITGQIDCPEGELDATKHDVLVIGGTEGTACSNASLWMSVCLTIAAFCASLTAAYPEKSFVIICVITPVSLYFSSIWYLAAAPYDFLTYPSAAQILPTFYFSLFAACPAMALGWYMFLGRRRAVYLAEKVGKEDAKKYDELWGRLLREKAGFRESLGELREEWKRVQSNAIDEPKRQEGTSTLCDLFLQADEINDLLSARLFELSKGAHGEFQGSETKKTSRALQKVFRSYAGDWRKLCDLCRASIKFDDVRQMAACLRAIGEHPEIVVIKTHDEKMRLREDYDASCSGGYRDIQLCVKLINGQTGDRRLNSHLCELQLHLKDIAALKKSGGHKNYVKARNLKGG